MTIRYTKLYTVKSQVNLLLIRTMFNDEPLLTLGWIQAMDEEENEALAEDGELRCMDSGIEFENGHVVCYGADGPGGGTHNVTIYIPQENIRNLEVEDEQE